jgi:hypothetical protein
MKPYRLIATDDALAGMQLYEDVCDRAGNVLLPRKTLLSASMISSLLRRAIEVLLVTDDAITPEHLAAERERVMARVAHLCRHCGDGRANSALRSAVTEYRLEEVA